MHRPSQHHKGRLLVRIRRVTPALFDPRLAGRGRTYAFQSLLATLSLLVILVVTDVFLNVAIVVAMASTVFIIFVVPDSVAATPRKVIGGHLAGVAAGSLVAAIIGIPEIASAVESSGALFSAIAALTVGFSVALMVVTNAEHPPAAGAALGLVVEGWSWSAIGVIIIGAIALSAIRIALRPRLINLL